LSPNVGENLSPKVRKVAPDFDSRFRGIENTGWRCVKSYYYTMMRTGRCFAAAAVADCICASQSVTDGDKQRLTNLHRISLIRLDTLTQRQPVEFCLLLYASKTES